MKTKATCTIRNATGGYDLMWSSATGSHRKTLPTLEAAKAEARSQGHVWADIGVHRALTKL